jgi:prephenate dehydrogenase
MTSPTEDPPSRPAPKARPRRVLVVGTGLVGGSVGLALRRLGWHVTGSDVAEGRAEAALERGALDAAGDDPDAELAVVAVPAAAAGAAAAELLARPDRRPELVVTDVSSVKSEVVRVADHPRFIGGHPMAGSEQLGLDGADPDLFVGASWVLTPTARTSPDAFSRLQSVVRSLGAEVVALSPEEHDEMVAVVSHVPHLVAATLMNAASTAGKEHAALLRLAAGGFRDMTRVAAGHPGIWPDICAENANAITAAFDRLLDELRTMRDLVADGDRPSLERTLGHASAARRALPTAAVRPETMAELRVPVPDRAGVLSELTTLAGDLGINIVDFEIAHSTEGAHGVLVLVVDAPEAEKLRSAIAARGYHCTVQELG